MYERSAIVLERYMEKILELNKTYNLKKNNENYKDLIAEIENYQVMIEEETKIIQEFEATAKKIENLQQEQQKIFKVNQKLEDDRDQLFNELGEDAKTLEAKLRKIEDTLEKNNQRLKELREEFVVNVEEFSQKQKDRNKCEKAKRIGEAKYIEFVKKVNQEFEGIDIQDITKLKEFMAQEKEPIKQEALELMTKNGKNEKVPFNQDVLNRAIEARIDIAEKQAECYILIYDRMKKLLSETDSETIKLIKYKKAMRDTSVKLSFLKVEWEYIIGLLDYERMTAIGGIRTHKKLMTDACNNFEVDLVQINNLYELILKEIANKATKKAYTELYNKTYLKNIEDKEKNFEEEAINVNISMGTLINSNYWRIEGIKNIYNFFQREVSEKFEKDLSDYSIDEKKNKLKKFDEEETYEENDENTDNEEFYDDEDDEFDVEDEESNWEEDNEDEGNWESDEGYNDDDEWDDEDDSDDDEWDDEDNNDDDENDDDWDEKDDEDDNDDWDEEDNEDDNDDWDEEDDQDENDEWDDEEEQIEDEEEYDYDSEDKKEYTFDDAWNEVDEEDDEDIWVEEPKKIKNKKSSHKQKNMEKISKKNIKEDSDEEFEDTIVKKDRKKEKNTNKKDNKGLFNKFFNK